MKNPSQMMHGPAKVEREPAAGTGLRDVAGGDERPRNQQFAASPDLHAPERLPLSDRQGDRGRPDDPFDERLSTAHDLELWLRRDERERRAAVGHARPR